MTTVDINDDWGRPRSDPYEAYIVSYQKLFDGTRWLGLNSDSVWILVDDVHQAHRFGSDHTAKNVAMNLMTSFNDAPDFFAMEPYLDAVIVDEHGRLSLP